MSKASKHFILGALVATLPLLAMTCINKSDSNNAGAAGLSAEAVLAQEKGLAYHSSFISRPDNAYALAILKSDQGVNNISLESTTKVIDGKVEVVETFLIDTLLSDRAIYPDVIYSTECQKIGDAMKARIVYRLPDDAPFSGPQSAMSNGLSDEAQKMHCLKIEESGKLDKLRVALRNKSKTDDEK